MHELQHQLLENHLPRCDDKTNKALLDNLMHTVDTLVLHTYDGQMLYNMNQQLQDVSIGVHARNLMKIDVSLHVLNKPI